MPDPGQPHSAPRPLPDGCGAVIRRVLSFRRHPDERWAVSVARRGVLAVFGLKLALGSAVLLAGYDEQFDQQLAIARDRRLARRGRAQTALDDLHRRWTYLPRLMANDLSQVADSLEEIRAHHDLVRMLLAARLFCVEQGRPPGTKLDLVSAGLGTPPVDPLAADGCALGFAVVGEELRFWSVGRDGVDDGGDGGRGSQRWKAKDVVLYAHAR